MPAVSAFEGGVNRTLKASLLAFGAFLLGLIVDAAWRPVPPDVKAWENRVIAYQRDSVGFEKSLSLLNGQIASLEESARVATREAVALKAQADRNRQLATAAKSRADSIMATVANTDTLVPRAAYDARTEEAVALRSEVGSLRDAFAAQQQATARLTAALDTSKAESELLTRRLAIADDLLRDRPKTDRCRVLWFDCPSRTTTFVAGAVLGAVGGVYVASR